MASESCMSSNIILVSGRLEMMKLYEFGRPDRFHRGLR